MGRRDDTPGGLAAELASHKERYEAGRRSVIERAHNRLSQINELRKEIDAEASAHSDVLAAAQQ